MFMNKANFWKAVKSLRRSIIMGVSYDSQNNLDNIIETVTQGDNQMANNGSEELSLQEDVARIIKRIKRAKETEELNAKADEVIAQLKKEL